MKIQSNGMGIQSVAMYLMSSLGELPRFDYSVFADTGAEKQETYKYIEWLKNWAKKNNGIPIIYDTSRNLYKDLLNKKNSTGQRFASIPGYTRNEDGSKGMLRRQCTNEYKIIPVLNVVKELLGLKKGQSYREEIEMFIGISLDEATRIAKPNRKNLTYIYPFCNVYSKQADFGFMDFEKKTRGDLMNWIVENGFPLPPKSSCVFCPFQQDKDWLKIKSNPVDWDCVLNTDHSVRDSTKKGIRQKMYLHDSLKPIELVKFIENQLKIEFNCGPFCNV